MTQSTSRCQLRVFTLQSRSRQRFETGILPFLRHGGLFVDGQPDCAVGDDALVVVAVGDSDRDVRVGCVG